MTDTAAADRRIARLARLGVWLVRSLGWTWRFQTTNAEPQRALRAAGNRVVFSLWHGQLLPLLYLHRNEGVTVLISEHRDGEIIARIAEAMGFHTVRGSTSRGAARALLELVRVYHEGHDIAITPDGPRGPAKSVAPGTTVVAQRAGAPVVAAVATATWAWRLPSWDRFLIPRPFARVRVAYSEPLYILTDDAREAANEAGRIRELMDATEDRISG